METVADFIFLGSKITADSDCSHEIKRLLLLGRKTITNLDSILKSRDITLPTKVYIVKAMVFPVVFTGCESWTMKKAEYWRTDAFKLWCWKRLLRVPWTARRSNQLIVKEISTEHSLEGLMLKLKLQYFFHLMQRVDSLGKTLMLERIRPGTELVSLALQGGFLTTGPPGKPQVQLLWWQTSLHASIACDPWLPVSRGGEFPLDIC